MLTEPTGADKLLLLHAVSNSSEQFHPLIWWDRFFYSPQLRRVRDFSLFYAISASWIFLHFLCWRINGNKFVSKAHKEYWNSWLDVLSCDVFRTYFFLVRLSTCHVKTFSEQENIENVSIECDNVMWRAFFSSNYEELLKFQSDNFLTFKRFSPLNL